jgi:hypothetical protein
MDVSYNVIVGANCYGDHKWRSVKYQAEDCSARILTPLLSLLTGIVAN